MIYFHFGEGNKAATTKIIDTHSWPMAGEKNLNTSNFMKKDLPTFNTAMST